MHDHDEIPSGILLDRNKILVAIVYAFRANKNFRVLYRQSSASSDDPIVYCYLSSERLVQLNIPKDTVSFYHTIKQNTITFCISDVISLEIVSSPDTPHLLNARKIRNIVQNSNLPTDALLIQDGSNVDLDMLVETI